MKKVALVPIDNRPVCYTLVEQICAIDKDIELFLPPRNFLGGLTKGADVSEVLAWLEGLCDIDILITSLDTIAYGGLTNSRRTKESESDILNRLNTFRQALLGKAKKVFAFSSILRISNNNINEEEKEYWNPWGTRIFEYSYNLHKSQCLKTANCVINQVPRDILEDYIKTRERNFAINKLYLNWLEEGILDFLVFAKDDSAEFGLNIKEANELSGLIKERNLNATVKTGADEIPLALLSRALTEGKNVSVEPVFLESAKNSLNAVSKYEDISLLECVNGQLTLAGIKHKEQADMLMVINNFQSQQGDLVLGERVNFIRADVMRRYEKLLGTFSKPYFLADVNNANGSDNIFVENIMKQGIDDRFFGYSAYNTSANTFGCAICTAVVRFLAKDYDENAFKALQFTRFMDDWAYQANVRKPVREAAPDFEATLKAHKSPLLMFEQKANVFLDSNFRNVHYSLPWGRSFEVEIQYD